MAQIFIILNDAGDGLVDYKSICETPDEIDENGEPTPAMKLAVKIIDEFFTND